HVLSRCAHRLMRAETPWLKRFLIGRFLRHYRVAMEEASQTDPCAYPSFNAFFTRSLRSDVHRVDHAASAVVSPVDGTISQFGDIEGDLLVQAKGRQYSLVELMGDNQRLADTYRNGRFICIYLAPHNYHRIHMPYDGSVHATIYAPGELFSVN